MPAFQFGPGEPRPASWVEVLADRAVPVHGAVGLSTAGLAVALGIALLAVVVTDVWRVLRVAVTLVHELGHAVVGMLVGRRFTGFVVVQAAATWLVVREVLTG